MKIILSHDVDHLFWSEHWLKDAFIPKLYFRTFKQYFTKTIPIDQALGRIAFWNEKRLNRITELTSYLKDNNLPSHFFFGMDNALGLSYNYKSSEPYISELKKNGFDVGTHGINFNNFDSILKEHDRFKEVSNAINFGIRMHYLRMNSDTPQLLFKAGYKFNSTIYDIKAPFKWPGTNLWEFPISVMESYAINYKTQNFDEAKLHTLDIIDKAITKKIPYFIINFHDTHFDKNYSVYKDWFTWLVSYLLERNYEFTTFKKAIDELEDSTIK